MQINVTGHHVPITPALRAHVSNKFKKLERHFENLMNVHVVLSVGRQGQAAEATLAVSGGQLFANSVGADMYGSINSLVNKLDRQAKRHRQKRGDHHQEDGGLKALETS